MSAPMFQVCRQEPEPGAPTSRRRWGEVVRWMLAASLLLSGCETFGPALCDRSAEGNPEVTYTGGEAQQGTYMSSSWDGPLLFFPGGMHYDMQHKLGSVPRWVQAFLSFEEYGAQDGGLLAPAAGNQAAIVAMDGVSVHMVNDSCVDYWLLVTAGTGEARP